MNIHIERLGLLSHTIQNFNLRWVIDINVKTKKFLVENTEHRLCNLRLRQDFLEHGKH